MVNLSDRNFNFDSRFMRRVTSVAAKAAAASASGVRAATAMAAVSTMPLSAQILEVLERQKLFFPPGGDIKGIADRHRSDSRRTTTYPDLLTQDAIRRKLAELYLAPPSNVEVAITTDFFSHNIADNVSNFDELLNELKKVTEITKKPKVFFGTGLNIRDISVPSHLAPNAGIAGADSGLVPSNITPFISGIAGAAVAPHDENIFVNHVVFLSCMFDQEKKKLEICIVDSSAERGDEYWGVAKESVREKFKEYFDDSFEIQFYQNKTKVSEDGMENICCQLTIMGLEQAIKCAREGKSFYQEVKKFDENMAKSSINILTRDDVERLMKEEYDAVDNGTSASLIETVSDKIAKQLGQISKESGAVWNAGIRDGR